MTVTGDNNRKGSSPTSQDGLATAPKAAEWPTPQAHDSKGAPGTAAQGRGGFRASLPAEVANWPTPCARDSNGPTRGQNAQGSAQLGEVVKHWQTPVASHRSGGNRSAYEGAPFRPALSREVKEWATPRASDADRGDCPSERARNSPSLVSQAPEASAPLNPAWVEALMGFPLGWTDPGPPVEGKRSTRGSRRVRRTESA